MYTGENLIMKKDNLIIDNLEDVVIVYNPEDENTHIFNQIGSFILENSIGLTISEVVEKLYDKLDSDSKEKASIEQILSDTIKFVLELEEKGLINVYK